MIVIPHKAKQFLLVLAKLLIVAGAFYYLNHQLQANNTSDWMKIGSQFTVLSFLGIVSLSLINWILEILKWQNLVSYLHQISFKESMKQTLGSLTASIFTPNRIGEYGAKMLYFDKKDAKKIVLLNLIGNSTQMIVTTFFGVFGLVITGLHLEFFRGIYTEILVIALLLIILLTLAYVFRNREFIYGFTFAKLIVKIKEVPRNIYRTNFQLATLRYFIFSHQFYFLLVLFGVSISYPTALATLFVMYFIASIVPTIHLMDVVIKGSVAVFLFGKLGVNEWIVVSITFLMWLLNLVLPVVIGSFFVMRFKLKEA
jgi:uncharacterized membrane protein YbhN (UPF0104 family)